MSKQSKSKRANKQTALTQARAVELALPGEVTPLAWRPPAALSFAQWAAAGKVLGRATTSLKWLLGDWWAYGKFDYGDRCRALAASGLDLSPTTLMNYGAVARAFERTYRRREVLSWSH